MDLEEKETIILEMFILERVIYRGWIQGNHLAIAVKKLAPDLVLVLLLDDCGCCGCCCC